jgi:hypothetical protein
MEQYFLFFMVEIFNTEKQEKFMIFPPMLISSLEQEASGHEPHRVTAQAPPK